MPSVLDLPAVSRVRRNHGLEHATLHILSRRHPGQPLSGHSDPGGFWLVGNVPTDEVYSAAQEALVRLNAGERQLAVHQNCGTNFVISGSMAALAAFVALFGAGRRFRDRLERLPLAATLSVIALIVAQPVGLFVQREVTTSSEPGTLEVVKIVSTLRGGVMTHRVLTKG
jgi:hypothetical protein